MAGTRRGAIRVDRARVEYPLPAEHRTVVAVDDASLSVRPGAFVSIVGPSGCGKTTVLMAIAGLGELSGGTVELDGVPVRGPGLDRAVVFQEAGLLPWRTVLGNVELGLEAKGVPSRERREIAERYVRLVRLSAFAHAFPHQLSGGMQQRVGIARALAVDPQVLLMDEPFGALDAQTRERLGDELLEIWARERKTVVFVTHSIDEAVYLSDRVVVMTHRPGRVRMEVEVELPRPRTEEVRAGLAFGEYRSAIWRELSEEVKRAEEEELAGGRQPGAAREP